jgi:hypothetical protein
MCAKVCCCFVASNNFALFSLTAQISRVLSCWKQRTLQTGLVRLILNRMMGSRLHRFIRPAFKQWLRCDSDALRVTSASNAAAVAASLVAGQMKRGAALERVIGSSRRRSEAKVFQLWLTALRVMDARVAHISKRATLVRRVIAQLFSRQVMCILLYFVFKNESSELLVGWVIYVLCGSFQKRGINGC